MVFPKTQAIYQPVLQDNELGDERNAIRIPYKKASQLVRFILIGISLLSIVLTMVIVALVRTRTSFQSSCGRTPTQARNRGCSFDLISFAWQTPECYDSDLVSKFAAWDAWNFYTERHGNITRPQEEVLRGEQSLWVSWQYHEVHCTFMWRQMHRAYEKGWIDAHLRAYNHTLHCQKILLTKGISPEEVFTRAEVIYPLCERVGNGVVSNWFNHIYSR